MATTSQTPQSNPLLSTSRASDTSPQIQLHPLVLLTTSDYITRHVLRRQEGPIIGAILGQQNGREITMEVAFECKVDTKPDGAIEVDEEWFNERLEQFKDVHKSPPLDFVGWFTLAPPSGPQTNHVPIHERFQAVYNEGALLLLFHPSSVETATGGKLPLTVYESLWETSTSSQQDDKAAMDIDSAQARELKFRELAYSVETGEAEMIGVDFVAKGGGNATAIETGKTAAAPAAQPVMTMQMPVKGESSTKGKGKVKSKDKEKPADGTEAETNGDVDDRDVLTAEEEELLSSLTAKRNAILMLRTRITLLSSYLRSLPPCYLTDASIPASQPADLNHPILRSIAALLARLPLLAPPDAAAFARESLEQKSDVQMTTLLNSITKTTKEARELGRKMGVVEESRRMGGREGKGYGGGGMSMDGGYGAMGMGGAGGAAFMDDGRRGGR